MDYAVMIVGGGPAGISTWLHLQKYAPQLASHTVVIDKAVFPRDKLCAGGVGGWSAEVFEHLEIELAIPSLFVSDIEFRFGTQRLHLHQPNFCRVVQRIEFDHALVKTAVNRGLNLHENESLISVVREKNGLIVLTSKEKYRIKILIGADGALSTVRRKMMPSHKPRFAPTMQISCDVDPQHDTEFHEKKMVIDFTPIADGLQGYVWHFPCLRAEAPAMTHGIGDFRIHRNTPRADMKKIFSRELQSRNIQSDPQSWFSHPIHWFSDEDLVSKPNVLLVGDAAGIEPVFGGGIHIALSYGEVAARAVMDAFQRNEFSFNDYKKRLQSHLVGEWIRDCTRLALEVYGGRMNPLDAARKLLPAGNLPSELIPQMLSEVVKTLQAS
jgi:flavin-dependent dehydrogenase